MKTQQSYCWAFVTEKRRPGLARNPAPGCSRAWVCDPAWRRRRHRSWQRSNRWARPYRGVRLSHAQGQTAVHTAAGRAERETPPSKATYCVIPLMRRSRNDEIIDEGGWAGTGGWGGGSVLAVDGTPQRGAPRGEETFRLDCLSDSISAVFCAMFLQGVAIGGGAEGAGDPSFLFF